MEPIGNIYQMKQRKLGKKTKIALGVIGGAYLLGGVAMAEEKYKKYKQQKLTAAFEREMEQKYQTKVLANSKVPRSRKMLVLDGDVYLDARQPSFYDLIHPDRLFRS